MSVNHLNHLNLSPAGARVLLKNLLAIETALAEKNTFHSGHLLIIEQISRAAARLKELYGDLSIIEQFQIDEYPHIDIPALKKYLSDLESGVIVFEPRSVDMGLLSADNYDLSNIVDGVVDLPAPSPAHLCISSQRSAGQNQDQDEITGWFVDSIRSILDDYEKGGKKNE